MCDDCSVSSINNKTEVVLNNVEAYDIVREVGYNKLLDEIDDSDIRDYAIENTDSDDILGEVIHNVPVDTVLDMLDDSDIQNYIRSKNLKYLLDD